MDGKLQIKQKINSAISSGDLRELEKVVSDISETQTRKEKRSLYEQMNAALVEAAFNEGQPELLSQLVELTREEIFDLTKRTAAVYSEKKDAPWFSAIFTLVDKLDRKSHQSDILARISRDLVQAGVDTGDIHYIEKAGEAFDKISIRKYRSAILSEIIPLFIQYGQKHQNVDIMQYALQMLPEIGDISRQSQLHADVARAIAGAGIESGDINLVISGLSSATEINQKIRRTNSIADIVEAAWKSSLKKEISDIERALDSLPDIPEERLTEVLAILTEQLLDRQRDKKQVYTKLLRIDDEKPWAGQTLVLELLKKAERSGERWFLEKAFEFNARGAETQLPIEEIVLSGIAVVEKSGNPTILLDITPLIDESCDAAKAAQLYRQITDALSRMGDFYHAIEVMKKASSSAQRINAQFFDTSVRLIKEGVRRDEIGLVRENILATLDIDIADSLVHQAVTDFCKEYDFDEVVRHIPAIKELAGSHRTQDTLLLECNTILIERGFVRQKEPSALVDLVSQIGEQDLREQAISTIAVEMARIGVARKDRDLLRHATGLTCEIMDQRARAEAMGGIVDQAAVLAVEDGDLDLLHGMRVLSTSLLEQDYCLFAMGKVVHGLIMYGIEQLSLQALDEAAQILSQIADPSLQRQLADPLVEGYVRVGSLQVADQISRGKAQIFDGMMEPFEIALDLLKASTPHEEISIKIASYVDIMLEYTQVYASPIFAAPMSFLSLEIDGEYERTAMIQRILTFFTDYTKEFDSADPYEVTAYLLEGIEGGAAAQPVLELMYRLLEHTSDVYARYTGMYRIVSAYSALENVEQAETIIRRLHETIGDLSDPSVRAIMLSDLAGLMAGIDHDAAREYLAEAQKTLDDIGIEREAFVRKNLIYAARNLSAVSRQEKDVEWAMGQVGRIEDPVEYVDALAAVFDMVSEPAQRKEILSSMCHTVVNIPSPYVRLSMLFDVAQFAETYGDEEEIEELLNGMERTAGYIQIPFITAMTQQRMAQMLFSFYRASGKPAARERAADIVSTIDDDRIRYNLTVQLEQTMPQSWKNTVYARILDCRDKIRNSEYTTKDMVTLDRAIRAAPDRAKRAAYYTELYLIARGAGQQEVADRMLLCALEEARIIRPLSRRAFVLGDMACRIYAERYEDRSREILDLAVSEALNIRDSTIRDEVYDELDMSMRIIQEHWL
ncbi:hypothetical protein FGW20_04300 [Methanoculleus sp. FWC-SCC3]|uniref:Uncharacterized protein n=1 Tax=Methanoculleus methanifontis TaxID=2584086 RepID=A0ABT8M1N1_9EURY|nr:hypothetical protein [Methanoculleus sp. FWC-SCC3]MDN7012271.1 hypothetical protein [Methanoculleus sp. FWC-SCC3]